MPANPGLFDLLKRVDPTCRVVSDGTPGSWYSPSKKMGYSRAGAEYVNADAWGECYNLNCPFCGDTHHHLFFSHLAGATVYIPGRKTPIKFQSSICTCHRHACQREDPRFKEWLDGLQLWKLPPLRFDKHGISETAVRYGLCVDIEDVLPQPCYPVMSNETPGHVRDYLWQRRYDPAQLQAKYGIAWCPQHATYENRRDTLDPRRFFKEERLVVPIMQGLTLVGWQARIIAPMPRHVPKYMTSPNLRKNQVIYNLDNAILHPIVVIVEGVFDVWRTGDASVCMFGKTVSAKQRLLLETVYGQAGGCIIALDQDAEQTSYKLAETFRQNDKMFPLGTVVAQLPENKDPDECTLPELQAILDNAAGYLRMPERITPQKLDDLLQGFDELPDEDF